MPGGLCWDSVHPNKQHQQPGLHVIAPEKCSLVKGSKYRRRAMPLQVHVCGLWGAAPTGHLWSALLQGAPAGHSSLTKLVQSALQHQGHLHLSWAPAALRRAIVMSVTVLASVLALCIPGQKPVSCMHAVSHNQSVMQDMYGKWYFIHAGETLASLAAMGADACGISHLWVWRSLYELHSGFIHFILHQYINTLHLQATRHWDCCWP